MTPSKVIKLEGKVCQVCAAPLFQKIHESVNRYNRKKYCSAVCARKDAKERRIGWYRDQRLTVGQMEKTIDELNERVDRVAAELKLKEERLTPSDLIKTLWPRHEYKEVNLNDSQTDQ